MHLRKYVKALRMYADVLKTTAVTVIQPDTNLPKNRNTQDQYIATNTKLMFLLYYINKNFNYVDVTYDKETHQRILRDDEEKYEEARNAIRDIFHGTMEKSSTEVTQQLWDLPPTLLETVIPVAIMRDFLKERQLRLLRNTTIVVHGKTIKPWRDFASRYAVIVLDA